MEGSGNREQGSADREVEPWLRGTLSEVDAVRRQVLHALELAEEDAERWCGGLTNVEVHARPFGVASVAFHLRHIVRSLDRLLTYAEGGALTEAQMVSLRSEMLAEQSLAEVLGEFRSGGARARERVLGLEPARFEEWRGVGRAILAEYGWRVAGALRGAYAETCGADGDDREGDPWDAVRIAPDCGARESETVLSLVLTSKPVDQVADFRVSDWAALTR